ncbi:MAG: pentapeptide repeat-containing protein [Gammaproteobacteria bacterium]
MGACASTNKGIDPTETSDKLLDLAKDCIVRAKKFVVEDQLEEAIATYKAVVIFLRDAGIEKPIIKELLIKSYLEQAELHITQRNLLYAEDCCKEAKKLGSESARIMLKDLTKRFKEADRTPSIVPTIIIGEIENDSQMGGLSTRTSPVCQSNTNRLSTVWVPPQGTLSLLWCNKTPRCDDSPREESTLRSNTSPRANTSPRVNVSPREYNTPRTPRNIDPKSSLQKSRSSSLSSSNTDCWYKKVPLGFPNPPGGLEHVWGFKANLHYSVNWIDKGTYKLHFLQSTQEDFDFIESLYRLHSVPNYEIAEVSLICDKVKEQTFVAGLDLLDKKYGNLVHRPKWKLNKCAIRLSANKDSDFSAVKQGEEIVILKENDHPFKVIYKKKNYEKIDSFILQHLPNIDLELLVVLGGLTFNNSILSKECCQDVERIYNFIYKEVKEKKGQIYTCNIANQITRNYLTELRYISNDVPHVKLLPLWQGVSAKSIKELGQRGFEDLAYSTDSLLGKGYYGVTNADVAYNVAQQQHPEEQILLMLGWYAGKVVYPIANSDQPDYNWWIRLAEQEPTDLIGIKNGKDIVVIKEVDPSGLSWQFKIIFSLKVDHNLINYHIVTAVDQNFPERLKSEELDFNGNVLPRDFVNEKIYEYVYKIVSANNGYIQPLLMGEPHYANYDMHFAPISNKFNVASIAEENNHYQTVVFDASQILPRYLVTLVGSEVITKDSVMKHLFDQMPCNELGKTTLIFQPDFSYSIMNLYKTSRQIISQQLAEIDGLKQFVGGDIDMAPYNKDEDKDVEMFDANDTLEVISIINVFLNDPNKEVLLLLAGSKLEQIMAGCYIETIAWNNYRDGKLIPLYIFLPNIAEANLTEHLVEDCLIAQGLSLEEIVDLKEHKQWLFILDGYEELSHKTTLIKSNYFNRFGGFKGKVLVLGSKQLLVDDTDLFFFTDGGTVLQQKNRFDKKYIKIAEEECQQKIYAMLQNGSPVRISSKLYEAACEVFQPTLPAPGGILKPWEYDNKLRYSPNWLNKGFYKIHALQPGDSDYDFVANLYKQTLVNNYEIDKIYLISDQSAELAFSANLALLSHRTTNTEYQPHWLQENNPSLRVKIQAMLDEKSYNSILAPGIKLVPLWHGTGPNQASGIVTAGFASLAIVDSGYFGKGLYGTSNAEYAYRVYASGYNKGNEILLLSWYATQNSYPVIFGDLEKLKGHANYQNYDSHFIPVVPESQDKHEHGTEDTYLPINDEQTAVYQEFVAFQTVQVLPRYILSLKEIGTEGNSSGIAKFLSFSSIDPGNRLKLYQKDIFWAIAALQHNAQLECEQNVILLQGLSLYVQPEVSNYTDNAEDKQTYFLNEATDVFLTDLSKEVWILEGNSGSGKSLFGRYLEKMLWENYHDGALIPIFISLPRLGDLNKVTDLIEKALISKGIPNKTILELKRKKKFLFILDAYSAIPNKLPLIKKYQFNELRQWRGKIIVLSRTNYMTNEDKHLLDPAHPGKSFAENANLSQKSCFEPFNNDQIYEYIEEFCCSEFNTHDWNLEQYQEIINRFVEIKEFLKEPFLLFLALNSLPTLSKQHHNKITVTSLYQTFMDTWFDNQFELIVEHGFDLSAYQNPRRDILSILEKYAENLAFSMFLQDTHVIDNPPENLEDNMNLGFKCCPLTKHDGVYSFVHQLFQEYFVAKAILDDLKTFNVGYEFLLHCKMQQKLFVNNTVILNFMSDQLSVRSNVIAKRLEKQLFNVMLASKEHPELRIAAANAATILNAAGIAFSCKDCGGLALTEANLSYGIFDRTSFENTDLSNVKFYCSWLGETNFKDAIMRGVVFGERACVKLLNPSNVCAYSSDGRYFAVASSKLIIIYDAETLQEIKTLTEHGNSIHAMAFNTVGSKLVSGDLDGKVVVWDLKKFRRTHAFVGHDGSVNGVVFNKHGDHVISAGQDCSVCLWDLRQRHCNFDGSKNTNYKHVFTGHTDAVTAVAISINGDYLATGSADGTVCLWDYEQLCHKYTFKGHANLVSSVAFSPIDDLLASGSFDKTICLWDYKFFCHKYTFTGHADVITSIAFSHVGDILASGSRDKTIRFWDISKLTHKHTFMANDTSINSIAFNAIGNQLAGSSLDSIVNFWDLNQSYYRHTFPGHIKPVSCIAINPITTQLISGSYDATIRLWDLQGFYNKHIFEGHEHIISSVAVNPSGNKLVSGSWDKTIRLWNTLDFCHDGSQQFCHQHVLMWPAKDFVATVAFSPIEDQVVFGGDDSMVKILDLDQLCQKSAFKGHTKLVSSVAFSPLGDNLASGSFDKTVRVWDLRQPRNKYNFKGHTNCVNSIAINPTGNYLASGSDDNTIRVWDLEQLCCKYILKGHANSVQCVGFSPDGNRLASGSKDNTIRLWDLSAIDNSHTEISTNIKEVQDSTVVKTNSAILSLTWCCLLQELFLVSGGQDAAVRLWKIKQDEISLMWSSCQNTLYADNANLEGAMLSQYNLRLLKQKGAINEPNIIDQRIEPTNSTNSDDPVEELSSSFYDKLRLI